MKRNAAIVILLLVVMSPSLSLMSMAQSPPPNSCSYQILKINLHAHTNCSDGTYSPSELVHIYKDAGYDVLGITDHSTVAGYTEALSEGEKVGLTVVCGEEVSCSWADGSWKHVLALFINESIGVAEGSNVDVKDIFDAIHAKNGIGIVAHPWFAWDKWQSYTNETYIDGWEVDYSMAWILQSDYIYLLGHDFHNATFLQVLPNYYTYVLAENRTVEGVRDAIMERRIVVCGNGVTCGSTEALGLYLEIRDREEPPSSPSPTPSAVITPIDMATPAPSSSLSPSPYATLVPSHEPTTFLASELFFAVAGFGLAAIAVLLIVFLRKRRP